MFIPLFLAAVLGAAILWSAAFTAAAVRAGAARLLFVVLAIGVPLLVLLPPAYVAACITFGGQWAVSLLFPLALALLLTACGGGLWIARAGLGPSADGRSRALGWPVGRLAAACATAALVAWGTVAIEERAVFEAGDRWHAEAARLMASNLPPATHVATTAASLHRHAAALLAADPTVRAPESPLTTSDASGPEAGALVARHAETLALVRRATESAACRFDRDWSRPSFMTLLPEIQDLRDEGRLVALAATRAAAEGRHRDAIADTIRVHRLASHADEPFLVSHLVGLHLRGLARDTLAEVLPRLGPGDVELLDDPGLVDMAGPPSGLLVPLLGEEGMILETYADVARARTPVRNVWDDMGEAVETQWRWRLVPDTAYRLLFLREEVPAIQDRIRRFQDLAIMIEEPQWGGTAWREAAANADEDPLLRRPLPQRITPGFAAIENAQRRSQALARAVAVALAATRMRLATGAWPGAAEELVPRFLGAVPADPYAADGVLSLKPVEGGIVITSVGPDGSADGTPPERGDVSIVPGRDDVGLWVAPRAPPAPRE